MANRVYLLSLPSTPHAFGDHPPWGAVAVAKYGLPWFWATLFDTSSIIGPYVGGAYGLAARLEEAGPRSEQRLAALAARRGFSRWPLADAWISFLRSLRHQPIIAADVHDLDLDANALRALIETTDLPPDHPRFADEFGGWLARDGVPDQPELAGSDLDGNMPPRALGASAQIPSDPPPSGISWEAALEGLLGETHPAAWARYFPHARPAPFRNDVAIAGPGAYLWYSQRASAWTVLWASSSNIAAEVFGAMPPASAPDEAFPPLPADIVGLDDAPLTRERLVEASIRLGEPVARGVAPRAGGRRFSTLVDASTISYFHGEDPREETCAILFRGAPTATPWT